MSAFQKLIGFMVGVIPLQHGLWLNVSLFGSILCLCDCFYFLVITILNYKKKGFIFFFLILYRVHSLQFVSSFLPFSIEVWLKLIRLKVIENRLNQIPSHFF